MLAAAEPTEGHFSVFDKASVVSWFSEQETPMLFVFVCTGGLKGTAARAAGSFLCLFRASRRLLVFFFLGVKSHAAYSMV